MTNTLDVTDDYGRRFYAEKSMHDGEHGFLVLGDPHGDRKHAAYVPYADLRAWLDKVDPQKDTAAPNPEAPALPAPGSREAVYNLAREMAPAGTAPDDVLRLARFLAGDA